MADARIVILAVVAATAAYDPTWTLRYGALVAAAVLLSSITTARFGRADALLVAFVTLSATSSTWTNSPEATALATQNFAGILAIFVSFRAVIQDRRAVSIAASGFLIGCLYSVWLVFTDNNLNSVRLRVEFSADRFGLDGVNQNYIAYSLTTGAALLVLLYATRRRGPLVTVVAAAAVAGLYVGVIQTGTRGALLGWLLLAVWLIVSRRNPARALKWFLTLFLFLNTLIVSGVVDRVIESGLTRGTRDTGDLNGRLALWPLARTQFLDHPWIGIGADGFRSANPLGINAHNVFLDVGAGLGLVGLLLMFGAIYAALFTSSAPKLEKDHARLVGTLLAVSIPILSSGFWHQSPGFWIAVALFSRLPLISSNPRNATTLSAPAKRSGTGPSRQRLSFEN